MMLFLAHTPQQTQTAQGLARALGAEVFLASHDLRTGDLDAAQRRARVTVLLLGRGDEANPRLGAHAALGVKLSRARPRAHQVVLLFVDGPPALLPEGLGGCMQMDLAAEGLPAVVRRLQVACAAIQRPTRSPRLPPGLSTGTAHNRDALSPAERLHAASEQVPFRGRKAFLLDLEGWIERPESLLLRLITAEAGAGKTRLGWELGRRRSAKGDKVKFLDGPPSQALLAALRRPAPRRVLLIVDEAARRVPDLRALVQAVLDHPSVHRSVRLVLLERAGGLWWEQLSDGLLEQFPLMQCQEERLLPALLEDEDERALHYAMALGGADPAATPPDLSDPRYVHPLWVQMAALLARQGATPPECPTALADAVLEQQRLHHARLIEGLTDDPAERRAATQRLDGALFLITLCGALPPAEALTRAGEALGLPAAPAQHIEAMALLFHSDRRKGDRLDIRLPDALGERWVATHSQRPALLAAGLDGPQADLALATLARWAGGGLQRDEAQSWLVDGLGARLERLGPRAIALAAGAAARDASEALCAALARVMETAPRSAVEALYVTVCARTPALPPALPAVRAAAAARLLADWERDCKERWWLRLFGWLTPRSRAAALRDARAARLHQCGVAWAAQFRDEAALSTLEEAVKLRRALAKNDPWVYLPDLVQSQGHLSHLLSLLARKKEALALAEELVAIARVCFEEAPSVYLPDLAASLHNLSQRLSAVGRRGEALRAAQESIELYRVLHAYRPMDQSPGSIQILRDLSALLRREGAHDEALELEREAADFLPVETPRAPTPEATPGPQIEHRAHGLVFRMKAERVATDGETQALPEGEKSDGFVFRVKVEREATDGAAKPPPDPAEDDRAVWHATQMLAQGAELANLDQREEALQATQGAVDLLRALPTGPKVAHRPLLASALNNLGNMLDAMGRRSDALEASSEAVRLRRELCEINLPAHRQDLVQSLCNLGNRLITLGRPAEAVAVLDEALAHLRGLDSVVQRFFRPDLAMALTNIGAAYRMLGRPEEALEATVEATEHYRALTEVDPRTYLPDLAMLLSNQGAMRSDMNDHQRALEVTEEACAHYQALRRQNVGAILPNLAACLNNLSIRYARLGLAEEALGAASKATETYRVLNMYAPRAFQYPFAVSLTTLACRLGDVGRHAEAVKPAQASVEQFRTLVALEPDVHLPGLAASLNNLGVVFAQLNRPEEALQATREAVDHFRHLSVVHPATGLPELAKGLSNLGIRLAALDRGDDALRVTKEGVQVARTLCKQSPVFQPILVANLALLARRLLELGRPEEAQRVQREVDAFTRVH